jgi:hypothetical protein
MSKCPKRALSFPIYVYPLGVVLADIALSFHVIFLSLSVTYSFPLGSILFTGLFPQYAYGLIS